MKAIATWHGDYQTRLEDGRGHAIVVDLPADEGGADAGTSALELSLLSLAGCITTIFALVARRRRLPLDAMEVELEGHRPRGSRTISSVEGTIRLTTPASAEDVETVLRITLKTCPVGALYDGARIPVRIRSVVEPPLDVRPDASEAVDSGT